MDKSKEYIEMCDCKEIQEGWKPTFGDLVYPYGVVFQRVLSIEKRWDLQYMRVFDMGGQNCVAENDKDATWLPRQDQLQGMLIGGHTSAWSLSRRFCIYINNLKPVDKSMEQLWLAFVMKEKFGKTWTGGEWK